MAGLVVGCLVATAALGGCFGEGASSGGPDVIIQEADRDLLGRWTDATGQALPDGTAASHGILVIETSYGSTTCTERNGTVFLRLTWPVGTEVDLFNGEDRSTNMLDFVRDTTGSRLETDGPSDLDVTLPKSARPTGFRRAGNTLHVDPKKKLVYVTRAGGTTERWARLKRGQGCA